MSTEREKTRQAAEKYISDFRTSLVLRMPFYGDIVLCMPFECSYEVPTAATDGCKIFYNPDFLMSMDDIERNYVMMHEVLHVIFAHPRRAAGTDPDVWNVAADMIVNNTLDEMQGRFSAAGFHIKRPNGAIVGRVYGRMTAEELYGLMIDENKEHGKGKCILPLSVSPRCNGQPERVISVRPDLLETDSASAAEAAEHMRQTVREAALKARGNGTGEMIPARLLTLTASKLLNWRILLRDFLTETADDDTSWSTPERKYLHMDLILPGHSMSVDLPEEVWCFVDCSGSIGADEMNQFFTQIYRIVKEFKCVLNVAFWDTSVHEVYRRINSEKELKKIRSAYSGGTNIDCIYRYMEEKRIRPDMLVVLTDGYYGMTGNLLVRQLKRKTILVLSQQHPGIESMQLIGKPAIL
ncbi:MAG: VWA-like domain-containing protein [Clostridia bacterium]|nr:VWA-like domain-containing protein [Clostridia bacterium]